MYEYVAHENLAVQLPDVESVCAVQELDDDEEGEVLSMLPHCSSHHAQSKRQMGVPD